MLDILAIGEIVIDFSPLKYSAAGNPVYEAQPGGAPSNMLAGAAMLGAKTGLIGAVGEDPLGEFLRLVAKRCKIDTKDLRTTDKAPTPFTIVEYDSEGNRSFYSLQTLTSLHILSAEMIDMEIISRSRVVYIAGSLLGMENGLPVYEKAKSIARDCGKIVCCDLNWRTHTYDRSYARNIILPKLEGLDILKLSHEEMQLLTDTWKLQSGCGRLRDLGVKLVCVTLGAGGSYFDYCGGNGYLPTYDVKVIDTNGAGDTFVAAMLVKLLEFEEKCSEISLQQMHEIMRFANAAGAVCASHKGAICAVPSREQIEYCLQKVPLLKTGVPENEDFM